MYIKKMVLLHLGLISSAIAAKDLLTEAQKRYLGTTNTYNGEVISPETVLELLNKESCLTHEAEEKVQNFIEDHGLAALLSGADHQHIFFCEPVENRLALNQELQKKLTQEGLQSLAQNSYILPVDDQMIIKKTRVPVACQNIVQTSAGNNWEGPAWAYGRLASEEEYKRWKDEVGGHLYQNTSRAMVYLRAREGRRLFGIQDRVTIPDTHLVRIPGRPSEVDDANYVVVEQRFGKETEWVQSPLAIKEDSILAMVKLIAATGWWTMQHAAGIVDDKICYYDHELPNSHDITTVFYKGEKGKEHFRALVQIGWTELENQIIKPYADAHKDDPEIQERVAQLLEKKHALQEEIKKCWK